MRVFLDLQASQNPLHPERGIARYVVEHANALLADHAPVARVGLNPALPRPIRLSQRLLSSPQLVWTTAREIRAAGREGPLAYHVMSPFETTPQADSLAPPVAFEHDAVVVTVYDLIPHLFAERYLRSERDRALYRTRLEVVRRADLVCAISEHTRQDVIRELGVDPERCVNIGGGASPYFDRPGRGEDPAATLRTALPELQRPFVLSVTGWDWRKNTEALIRSFARLPDPLRRQKQLVLTCAIGQPGIDGWRAVAAEAGLAPEDVLITGLVPDGVLRALYQTCDLFVFPSLYEGFGLPVLEAARCGAPALTSAVSSLPEILDAPESCFDPHDEGDIADHLERGLTDEGLRARLLAAGGRAAARHTWAAVARRTAQAYAALDPRPRAPRRPCRVALVGPLPPSRSGVATYTARVLPHLPAGWELTCFYEGDRPDAIPGVSMFPVEQLGRLFGPREFDAVVHVVGNSTFHSETIERAVRYGGIVWLHDVNLAGIGLYDAGALGGPHEARLRMRHLLDSSYGDRVPPGIFGDAMLDPQAYRDAGLRLSARVVAGAEHVVVNSSQAAALLRYELGPDRQPPISVVPHFLPSLVAFGLHDLPPRSATPLVVSLGILDEVKCPFTLLDAVAALPTPTRLRFVGVCAPELEARLHVRAEELAFSGLELTGELPNDRYATAAAEGWVAVQLRAASNGESSGAVHDALALGLPVITNIPSAGEIATAPVVTVDAQVSVRDLTTHISSVVADRDRAWAEATASAGSWTAADVAARLAEVVCELVDRPAPSW